MHVVFSDTDKKGNEIKIAREVDRHYGYAFYIYANRNCIWKCETRELAVDFVKKECL